VIEPSSSVVAASEPSTTGGGAGARRWIALGAVALALAIGVGLQVTRFAGRFRDNVALFSSPQLADGVPAAWNERVASRWLAVRFVTAGGERGFSPWRVGLWSGAWFLLAELALLAARGRSQWIWTHLFGLFAGVSCGYFLDPELRSYPWDLPALAVFVVALQLFDRDRRRWLLALVPIGVLFKETALLLPLLWLPGSRPRARRAAWVGAGLGLGLAAKLVAHLLGATAGGGAALALPSTELLLNLRHLRLTWLSIYTPLLFNAGTLVALALLPARGSRGTALRLLGGAFAAAALVFARLPEARIWFELLPVALLALERSASAAR